MFECLREKKKRERRTCTRQREQKRDQQLAS